MFFFVDMVMLSNTLHSCYINNNNCGKSQNPSLLAKILVLVKVTFRRPCGLRRRSSSAYLEGRPRSPSSGP